MRDRQSGELSFSDPFSSDHRFKGLLSLRDTKWTFPEAGGVPRLSLELDQVLKADPAAVWMRQQRWAPLWYPPVPGRAGSAELHRSCLYLRDTQNSHDAAVPITPRFWRNKPLSPGLSIHSFFTGTKTHFQLKPGEIR